MTKKVSKFNKPRDSRSLVDKIKPPDNAIALSGDIDLWFTKCIPHCHLLPVSSQDIHRPEDRYQMQ